MTSAACPRKASACAPAALVALVAAAAVLALSPSAAVASLGVVRGVAPADQELYSGGVACAVAGVERLVPLARVNDDYCDCDDGKDEPGTAACSYLVPSVFYCANGGYFPKHIHTSLLNDEICDCCDGSDEFAIDAGGADCADTCAHEAIEFRQRAVARLADVEEGFTKREEELQNVVEAHFHAIKEKDALSGKTLAALAKLKDRVEVHKARVERQEKMMRLEAARKQQFINEETSAGDASTDATAEATCVPNAETGTTCENPEVTTATSEAFQEVDALDVAADKLTADVEDDTQTSDLELDSAAADESTRQRSSTMVELSDGTKVSLADYLRMDHTATSKTFKGPARTADQRRREDFMGPLFNGNGQDRKRMGLYALRSVGILISPLRLAVEALLFIPRMLSDIATSSVILSPYLDSIPTQESIIQSPTFRRLGDGHVYAAYKNIAWGGRVVWDAPIVAYQYLFPKLDLDLTLPEAESLRQAVKEIEDDMDKLRKEKEAQQTDLDFDYGPERVFFALKDQCIEKKVEKYVYKICAFQEVKQDYTNLGKWQDWGKTISSDGAETTDYNVMLYTKGAKCWNGPERSVKISLDCASTNEILSVDEPSTCVYEMKVQSYVACTSDVRAQARAELAFWSPESN